MQALKDRERSTQLQDKQRLAAQQLLPLKRAFQPAVLRQLEPWRLHYQALDDRYKFLVLRGVSRSGKSSLAKALGALMNWGKPFVQTVQGATAADLKKFSEDEHGYLIFDNVNDQEFILPSEHCSRPTTRSTLWRKARLAFTPTRSGFTPSQSSSL